MKSLFLIESRGEIDRVKAYAKKNAISSYELHTVSTKDPYFYDTFSCADIESWENVEEFLHQRIYSWIYQFRENSQRLDNFLSTQGPYAQSLKFYLAMRYGMDYRYFSNFLTNHCAANDVTQIFVNSLASPYVVYLREIRPFGSVTIASYES